MLQLSRLRDYLRSSLWFIPVLMLIGFIALAAGMAYLDRTYSFEWLSVALYRGTAEGARTILTTIATSMLSLTALVFSITLVVLQLAGSQLTPRVMSTFLRDRWSKIAMGSFLGTFAYALVALWFVRAPSEGFDAFVPVLMVTVAFVAVGVSITIFINYIHRVAQSIRVEHVTMEIGHETLDAVREEFPPAGPDGGLSREAVGDSFNPGLLGDSGERIRDVAASRSGYITVLSSENMVHWARARGVVIEVFVALGEFVIEGSRIMRIYGDTDDEAPLARAVSIGPERSIDHDPAYGVRQLVDIALRALSPGVNEPGTAVIALDRVEEILLAVGQAALPGPAYYDEMGMMRAIVPRLTWSGWVALSCREIIDYGGESVQVCGRLSALLEDLHESLPEDRRTVLEKYAEEVATLPGSVRPFTEWAGYRSRPHPDSA